MINWDLFIRDFTRIIFKTHPYELTMLNIIHYNFRVHNNLIDLIDVE